MKLFSSGLFLLISFFSLNAQETLESYQKRMQWFEDAKLGIFIHWGIYSVNGIDESWSFFNNYIPYEDYMQQLDGFNASDYDPSEWVQLIEQSGAKYAVLTTKHHDGVALWDTGCSGINVVENSAAKTDLIQPFVKAVKKSSLKLGLYYSLLDWSHPDYPNKTRTEKRYETDSVRWNRFVAFNFCQLEEITKKYNPDLYWFDGDWEQSAEAWRAEELSQQIRAWQPNIILNSRITGFGDYGTPEQGVPISRPKDSYWELCMTMNDSWGYQHNDHNYKSPQQIIEIFTETLHKGGNLLLDIGPKADGTIPTEQVEILESLGRWTSKHKEAIYGSRAGIDKNYYHGTSTLNSSGDLLYLFVPHDPKGHVTLRGIKNKINRIWVVGDGTKLSWDIKMKQYWSEAPGIVYIDVPDDVLDENVTVLAILLDGKIDLYNE